MRGLSGYSRSFGSAFRGGAAMRRWSQRREWRVLSALARHHGLPLLPCLLLMVVLFRHLLFSANPPAGVDTLGWIASAQYLASKGRFFHPSWLDYSLGVSGGFSRLPIYIAAVNGVIGSPVFVIKAFMVFAWVMAAVLAYMLAYSFWKNRYAAGGAALLYTLNPLFTGLLGSGQLNLALGMAMGPGLFLLVHKALTSAPRPALLYAVLLGLLATAYVIVRLDFLLYFLPWLVLFALALLYPRLRAGKLRQQLPHLALLAGVALASLFTLGAFAVVPELFGVRPPYESARALIVERLEWYSSPLLRALGGIPADAFIPYVPRIPRPAPGTFEPTYWSPTLILLGMSTVFFTTVLFLPRSRGTTILLVGAIIGSAILASGSRGVLGGLYTWAFLNIPLANIMHIPSRWLMVTQLALAMAVAGSVAVLALSSRRLALAMGVLFLAMGIAGNYPMLARGLQTWQFPGDEVAAYRFLAEIPGDYRVMTIPFGQESMFTDDHGVMRDLGFESQLFHDHTVLRTGEGMVYSRDVANYLVEIMGDPQFKHFGELLSVFNVRYVVDTGREGKYLAATMGRQPNYQRSFIQGQEDLTLVWQYGNAAIYENTRWRPRVFAAQKVALVVGGLDVLRHFIESPAFNLEEYAVVLASDVVRELGEEGLSTTLEAADAVIFSDADLMDLAMLLVPRVAEFNPSSLAQPSVEPHRHWVELDPATPRAFVMNSRSLVTTAAVDAAASFKVSQEGFYEVWARVATIKDSANLAVEIDGQMVGQVRPADSPGPAYTWRRFGEASLEAGSHRLRLVNFPTQTGSRNFVDQVLLVKLGDVSAQMQAVEDMLLEKGTDIFAFYSGDSFVPVFPATAVNTPGSIELRDVCGGSRTANCWRQGPNLPPTTVQAIDGVTTGGLAPPGQIIRLSLPPERQFRTVARYDFSQPRDFSQALAFAAEYSLAGSLRDLWLVFYFGKAVDRRAAFDLRPNAAPGWQRSVLALDKPTITQGEINWAEVTAVTLETAKEGQGTITISLLALVSHIPMVSQIHGLPATSYWVAAYYTSPGSVSSLAVDGHTYGTSGESPMTITRDVPLSASRWTTPNRGVVTVTDRELEMAGGPVQGLYVDARGAARAYQTLAEMAFAAPQDWSQQDGMLLWFLGNGTGEELSVKVFFGDGFDNFAQYDFRDSVAGWQRLVFNLIDADRVGGKIDWRRVTRVRLQSTDKTVPLEVSLGQWALFQANTPEAAQGWGLMAETVPMDKFARSLQLLTYGNRPRTLLLSTSPAVLGSPPAARARDVTFIKSNPTSYRGSATLEAGDVLVLGEAFHPAWATRISGKRATVLPVYHALNGYLIDSTGEVEFKANFSGQRAVVAGFWVSIVSVLLGLAAGLTQRSPQRAAQLRATARRMAAWAAARGYGIPNASRFLKDIRRAFRAQISVWVRGRS